MATASGISEFARRLATALLTICAFAAAGRASWPVVALLQAAAVAAYALIPHRPRPPGAFTYDRMTSQVVPDWLGFVLSALFAAIPVWAARAEPGWGAVHPSAALLWPMAALCSAFWLIGAVYAAWWLRIDDHGLTVHSARAERRVVFADIRAATRGQKALPRWMIALAPALVGAGRFGAAGALLLARPRNGLTLHLADGTRLTIAEDALGAGLRALHKALASHGIPDNNERTAT
ncbi:hypothetical protein P1J78_01325 [Psychromarinibacter sp. C21-152]|uniref:PH domain-containing protein n=1 Tax=Psychromarinibacter sediminicola TaxID=3033385 RepID=A0AAE3T6K6_9RHOB|nr:hypothetical protein [Psychromarinibacter sediminicola]MDF0599362.1 hypothetical protein [Psychromarinibacter sediminicola]